MAVLLAAFLLLGCVCLHGTRTRQVAFGGRTALLFFCQDCSASCRLLFFPTYSWCFQSLYLLCSSTLHCSQSVLCLFVCLQLGVGCCRLGVGCGVLATSGIRCAWVVCHRCRLRSMPRCPVPLRIDGLVALLLTARGGGSSRDTPEAVGEVCSSLHSCIW